MYKKSPHLRAFLIMAKHHLIALHQLRVHRLISISFRYKASDGALFLEKRICRHIKAFG